MRVKREKRKAICPICKKEFVSTWNNFTGKYKVFCSRQCVRKNNVLKLKLKVKK
jgi:endogenous inhibitor of DNA gyrase (YacG/DUF329 family)